MTFAGKKISIKNKKVDLLLMVIFCLVLEVEYYSFVAPLFKSMGFLFLFSWTKFIVGMVFLALIIVINHQLKGFNYFINSLFLFFLSIPSIILFKFQPNTPITISLFLVLFHILFYISTLIKPHTRFSALELTKNSKFLLLFIITLAMLLPFIYIYGGRIYPKVFMLKDIYAIRGIYSASTTILTAYFFSPLVKILIPIGLIYSILQRNKLLFVFFILAQLYLFGISGHKSVFFSLLILPILLIKSYERQTKYLIIFILLAVLAAHLISQLFDNILLESIVVRRAFFLPAIITNDYFDFFQDKYIFLSNSIFKTFVAYPFELPPPQIIGLEYFHDPNADVNSGFISTGYMNFGYLGVFLNSISVILLFKLFDFMKISSDYSGIFLIIVFTIISSAFLTSLLTHGILLFILLAFFLLKNSKTVKHV